MRNDRTTLATSVLLAAAMLAAPSALGDVVAEEVADEMADDAVQPEVYYPFTDLGGMTVPEVLSREDWPEQTVRPVDGRTAHNPTYVHPIELRDDAAGPLAAPTVEERMVAALGGAVPMHYDWLNIQDTAMGWGWFAADTASAIPRMIFQPPLAEVTTPPGVSDESWGFFFPEPIEVEGGGAFDNSSAVSEMPAE
ncbi:MAG: hypothetical protein AAGK09_11365 [Planctomycetota bacterium]